MPCPLLALNALPCSDREEERGCGCNIVGIAGWLCGEGLRRALRVVPMARGAPTQSQDCQRARWRSGIFNRGGRQ